MGSRRHRGAGIVGAVLVALALLRGLEGGNAEARGKGKVAAKATVNAKAKAKAKTKTRAKKAVAKRVAVVEALTAEGLPNVQSAGVVVLDADSGAEVWSKGGDDVREMASTGKIFVALLVRARGIDLDGKTTIEKIDQTSASGGSRTRLDVGATFTNGDLMRAMLLASDNRAVTALGRAVGLEPDAMVDELNALAATLGMTHTRFVDPIGLRANTSTPRELALALRETLKDPVLTEIMTTRFATIHTVAKRPRAINYANTNVPLHRARFPVSGGKTGYNTAAGYCFVVGAQVGGRDLVMAFLGSKGKLTRFADFTRVSEWYAAGGVGAALAPR